MMMCWRGFKVDPAHIWEMGKITFVKKKHNKNLSFFEKVKK